uniref:Putative secreted protein n=1 Tax=Ixodes ricinus TaxID=34613 RepID=A0A6B0U5P0_IXORI
MYSLFSCFLSFWAVQCVFFPVVPSRCWVFDVLITKRIEKKIFDCLHHRVSQSLRELCLVVNRITPLIFATIEINVYARVSD